MIGYFSNLKKKHSEMRLVMTILCRNEEDIIEANIRVHAALGVDAFVVMNNASNDETLNILLELKHEYDLEIVHESGEYQQAKWMTKLARIAQKKMGANLIICNDADEFWLPLEGNNLKRFLRLSDSVVQVQKSNMLLTESTHQPGYRFYDSIHRVIQTTPSSKIEQQQNDNLNLQLVKLSPKVIVNPYGLIKISGGNHRAKHLLKMVTARQENQIRIYHYPIRSYQQFLNNIVQRKKLLSNPNIKMGDHYRRWVRQLTQGKLQQEFERLVVQKQQLKSLLDQTVVELDHFPKSMLSRHIIPH